MGLLEEMQAAVEQKEKELGRKLTKEEERDLCYNVELDRELEIHGLPVRVTAEYANANRNHPYFSEYVECQFCGDFIARRFLELHQKQDHANAAQAPEAKPKSREEHAPVKLGYRFGRRPVEKILAFCLSSAAIVWFLWGNHSISNAAGSGLLSGTLAPFVIGMLNISAMTEGWLLMGATVLIGLKLGFAAFGLSIVGYLLFTALLFAVLAVSNSVLFAKAKKAKS